MSLVGNVGCPLHSPARHPVAQLHFLALALGQLHGRGGGERTEGGRGRAFPSDAPGGPSRRCRRCPAEGGAGRSREAARGGGGEGERGGGEGGRCMGKASPATRLRGAMTRPRAGDGGEGTPPFPPARAAPLSAAPGGHRAVPRGALPCCFPWGLK